MDAGNIQVRKLALSGMAWSLAQNWGGRLVTFLIFVILARLLTPEQFGLASAAMIVFMLISLVAEFGFGDAIIQRREYKAADANLPFFFSVSASILLAVACAANADRIEVWLDVPGIRPIIVAFCVVAPLQTIMVFQEMQCRRSFQFRRLALRVLIANMVAGIIAIGCALAGMGVWSLVIQAYLVTIIGLVWLWSRPVWLPTLEFHARSFIELARFSAPVATMRYLEFGATRCFEVVLISHFGAALFGLYAAGARFYQILTQLLQAALNNVSLTILSRISDDTARMSRIYLTALTIATLAFAPIFVMVAALFPEISDVLFGSRWSGMDAVARPLLLLGAVQSVQFINGPYLASRGRPGLVTMISSLKSIGIIMVALFTKTDDIVRFVQLFVIVQFVETPLSFLATGRELSISPLRIIRTILPGFCSCIAAYISVSMLRPAASSLTTGSVTGGSFMTGICLGLVFVLCFGVVIVITGRSQVELAKEFVLGKSRLG